MAEKHVSMYHNPICLGINASASIVDPDQTAPEICGCLTYQLANNCFDMVKIWDISQAFKMCAETEFKVKNMYMTGAINYVRREILSSHCYFNMAAPIGLSTVTSNIEKLEFLSSFIHAFC